MQKKIKIIIGIISSLLIIMGIILIILYFSVLKKTDEPPERGVESKDENKESQDENKENNEENQEYPNAIVIIVITKEEAMKVFVPVFEIKSKRRNFDSIIA